MSAHSNSSAIFRKRAASIKRALLLLLGFGAFWPYSFGQFVGTRFNIDSDGTVELQYFGSDDAYYILKRGDSLVGVFTIRDMVLGDAQMVDFTEGITPLQSVYYQLDEVPLTRPLDSDKDGIDDAFELAHPNILDPLDPLDSGIDSDNDGVSNFEEYVRGTDIAAVSNIAPKVNLVLPASGSGFVSPASIPIRATATDQDGSIARVDFFQGTQKIGEDSTAPFEFSWSNVTAGDYVLTAVAIDDNGSSATTLGSLVGVVDSSSAPLTVINTTSPLIGAQGVAVTRETIISLSNPLADSAVVDSSVISLSEGGEDLSTRIEVSKDRRKIRVFYDEHLPSNSRVNGIFDGSLVTDLLGRQIDADGDGEAGGAYEFFFDTLNTVSLANTSVCGRVFASELAQGNDAGSVNVPLAGVRVSVDGQSDEIFAFTDQFGDFRLENVPAGRFFVHIDGREVTRLEDNIRYPDLAYYPNVGKAWVSIPNEEVNIGEVYLPLINEASLQTVSADEPTVIGFPIDVIRNNPELKDLQIEVPANSLFRDDGTRGGMVGIAPVPPDRLPGQLPEGLDFPVVITVQTDGATNFDVPVPICAPNLDGLAPGEKTALWSFNHDTGQFEIVGPATVSADGKTVCTDPGVGITAPGWHGFLDRIFVFLGRMFGFPPGFRLPPTGTNQDCARNDCPCPGRCSTTNEVLLHSGEEYYVQDDLIIPGRAGLDFVMRRTYRSQLEYDGPLGHGWNWDYNEGLYIEENGDVVRVNGRSHIATWKSNGDGTFEAPEGYFGVLMQDTDGSYLLITPDGFERYYREDGRLFCHQDQFGNRMLFDYDHFGNLTKVIDVYGREIDFTFTLQNDGKRRLTKVTDFVGREVVYEYDNNGDLISCRSPIVEGTSTGNDFPNGRIERYTYSSGFEDEALNHNLLSITRPQEVADGGGGVLQWTYGTDPNDPLTYDKVISEMNGGTNNSGIAAGGTMTIEYEALNEIEAPGQPDLPRGKARVVSRNGNVMEYFVNEKNYHIITREFTNGLRAGEPQFFETKSFYNDDGLVTRVVFPEGNEVQYVYDDSGDRRNQSNLLEKRRVAGPRGGGDDLVTTYTYEPLFNRVLTVTDPRGNDPNFQPSVGTWDPDRYTTRYFYDYQESDSPIRLVELFDFDLSSVDRGLGDLNGDGRTDQQFGNLIRIEGTPVELLPDSSEAQRNGSTSQKNIVEMQWNDSGQILAQIDPEGNVSENQYHPANDPDGDGLLTKTRYVFLDNSPTGYLKAQIEDSRVTLQRTTIAEPLALKTTFRYDQVGNRIGTTDPRGILTSIEYNQLDEPVSITTGASVANALARDQLVSETQPFRYRKEMIYDFNGRVTRLSVDNRDGAVAGVGEYLDTTYVYDILDNVVRETTEVDADTSLVTRFEYDASELRTKVIKPEGNEVISEYDERDLIFRRTRAPNSDNPSTIEYDYDGNMNVVRLTDSEDTDGDGSKEFVTNVYDGFDRLVTAVDAIGNQVQSTFAPNSVAIRTRVFGHPPGQVGGAIQLYSDVEYSYDERNRLFRTDTHLFVPEGFAPSRVPEIRDGNEDGVVTEFFEFDANSRVARHVDDDGEEDLFEYDGLDRLIMSMDDAGNTMAYVYDANGNVIEGISTEVTQSPGIEFQTFSTYYVFDQLNRMVRVTDNVGQTRRFEYDRRNNLIRMTDSQGIVIEDPWSVYPGLINDHGNVYRYVYDGLDRRVSQISELRTGGTGNGDLDLSNEANPDALVELQSVYDLNSRLVAKIDDKGQATRMEYDLHDRLERIVFADGTESVYQYDEDNNVTQQTDPNGSVVIHNYDGLNRLVQSSVTPAQGVVGTSLVQYEYDGVSRVSKKVDNGGPGDQSQEVEMVYDSLTRVLEETQNGQSVSSVWSGDGSQMKLIYPGGKTLEYEYDSLDRAVRIHENGETLFSTEYIGSRLRETKRMYGNGTALSYLNDAGTELSGYDDVKRTTSLKHVIGNVPFVNREYDYNRMSLRTSARRIDDGQLVDNVVYDSLYRIAEARYDQEGIGEPGKRDIQMAEYQFDGVGNRVQVEHLTGAGEVSISYTANEINEYVSVDGQTLEYDANGNLISDGINNYSYDYRNRIAEVRVASSGNLIARYGYYSDNRRSIKEIYDPDVADQLVSRRSFFYQGYQEVEEVDADTQQGLLSFVNNPMALNDTFLVSRSASNPLGEADLYLHCDVRMDVVSVSDSSGNEIEEYVYDEYGNVEGQRTQGVPFSFQGHRFDEETGLYYARNRYYNPNLGRFVQRDPHYDSVNMGNQYSFGGNSPFTRTDPMGTNTANVDPAIMAQFLKKLQEVFGHDAMGAGNNALGGLQDMLKARGLMNKVGDLTGDINKLNQLAMSGDFTKSYQNIRQANGLSAQGQGLLDNLRNQRAGLLDEVADTMRPSGNPSFANNMSGVKKAAGSMGHLDLALNAISESQNSMNTTWTGAGARVGGVAVNGALLGSTPHGAILQMSSGIVDNLADLGSAYELWGPNAAPKLEETFKNAGRSFGVIGDFISDAVDPPVDCRGRARPNRGWQSMRKLVNHMKNDQGSFSRELVESGEWWGEKMGSLYNWATGESDRAARLERQRQAMLARRRN